MHVEFGEMVEDTQDRGQDDDLTVLRWWMESELTPIAEIRDFYSGVYEECGAEEIEGFVGSQMFCEGYELAACENDAQRMGWADEGMVSAQYDAEAPTEYDAEALADAEQAVRDNADRALRVYQYA